MSEEEQDELSRGPFAALIAAALLTENKRQATVVGLTGSWGTGKSTVANFVINRIKQADKEIPIVRFEPWMVSSSEALAREFFKELGKAVLPRDDSKDSKEKRARFYKYTAQALSALALTTDAAQLANPAFGLASKVIKGSGKAIELAAKGLEAQAHLPTLREARDTISEALVELKKPVVVVIDDIDRLNKEEVRTVFQIIKACADFPNIRYLLLYDRQQVEHALDGYVVETSAFLEKIVLQVFDLPLATGAQRQKLIEASIDALGFGEIEGRPLERLLLLFDAVLLPGLSTVRQIKRFFSTASTLIPGVIVDGFRNVDPADFLALEYIRQFSPSFYELLRDEEEPQPGGRVDRMVYSKEFEETNKKLQADTIDALPDRLRKLCSRAYKTLDENVSESNGTRRSWSAIHHSERRFRSSHYRKVYLGFQAGEASITEEAWQRFVSTLLKGESLNWLMIELSDLDQRDKWVHIIADRTREIPLPSFKRLLVEIFRWAEQQPRISESLLSSRMDWTTVVYLVSAACLIQIHDGPRAVTLLTEAIQESETLIAPSYFVGMEFDSLRENHYSEWCEKVNLDELVNDLTKKVTALVETGDVWDLIDPYHAIIAWGYLVGTKRYKTWRDSLASDSEALNIYLNKFLGSGYGLSEDVNWGIDSDDSLIEAITNTNPSDLSEAGRWARTKYIRSEARSRNRGGRYPRQGETDSSE